MAKQSSGSGGSFVSFISGALFGAALGLLLAPTAGKEARQLLEEKHRELKKKVNKLKEEFHCRGSEEKQ